MAEDKRELCKYGANCYQTNESHLKKYKHEKKLNPQEDKGPSPEKKAKTEESKSKQEPDEVSSSKPLQAPPVPSSSPAVPAAPLNVKESIKQKFLVDMPNDFYSFWEFCKSLNKEDPSEALASCGLHLVGPFDVLSGALQGDNYSPPQLLRHWRYFFDPPEFQTVVRGDDKTQFHLGYFRDDPSEPPVYVGSNCAAENCVIKSMGPNLFAAVDAHLTALLKATDPFQRIRLKKLQGSLQAWAKREQFPLSGPKSPSKRRPVCQGFHKAGIVVPYNKSTTIGYRKLETEGDLRKLLDAISGAQTEQRRQTELENLDGLITAANIANDESDFGGALELGLNLFSHGGPEFHTPALGLLNATYMLLRRQPFARILQAHLEDRKKGVDLSIIAPLD